MPVPLWVGKVNKRVFNPREIRKGSRPVLSHVGRSSGTTYRTPLDAHRAGDSFIFILVYGSGSDWVRNVLAAGGCELEAGGERFDLTNPRLLNAAEAWEQMPETASRPPGFLNIGEYLQMDIAAT